MTADILRRAENRWGAHPMDWPRPPMRRPHWWQRKRRRYLERMEAVFGPLDQIALDAFWREAGKGQSVYEDCGGFLLRCYNAMLGQPTEEPYTYRQAVDDFLAEARTDAR